MLKILASQYLGIPAKEVEIIIGANKKPFIISQSSVQIDYNISHSGNWIVMVFGIGSNGIDVEQIQADFNFEPLLPACFSSTEQNFIQSHSNSRECFYRLWTRKESFVKATSKGLDETLPQIICLDGAWDLLKQFSLNHSWEIWSFPLDHEHVASLTFVEGKKNILFLEQDIAI
jgi:4'-phosphopantetheinyl transferase